MTSLTFYGNKDDTKVDHQAMLAATCTSAARESVLVSDRYSILDTAGYVKVWHYPSQQCVWTFDEKDRQPLALDFNSTYTRLLVAGTVSDIDTVNLSTHSTVLGSDCAINCYDFTTKKLVRQLKAS